MPAMLVMVPTLEISLSEWLRSPKRPLNPPCTGDFGKKALVLEKVAHYTLTL
jgi:hypothetical protein